LRCLQADEPQMLLCDVTDIAVILILEERRLFGVVGRTIHYTAPWAVRVVKNKPNITLPRDTSSATHLWESDTLRYEMPNR